MARRVFVTLLLAFSFLASFSARLLLPENDVFPSPNDALKMDKAENIEVIIGRMDLETNRDYPGSGANDRHTPRPPLD